jgi:hypothetical protein
MYLYNQKIGINFKESNPSILNLQYHCSNAQGMQNKEMLAR